MVDFKQKNNKTQNEINIFHSRMFYTLLLEKNNSIVNVKVYNYENNNVEFYITFKNNDILLYCKTYLDNIIQTLPPKEIIVLILKLIKETNERYNSLLLDIHPSISKPLLNFINEQLSLRFFLETKGHTPPVINKIKLFIKIILETFTYEDKYKIFFDLKNINLLDELFNSRLLTPEYILLWYPDKIKDIYG